jgi:hypothetical protein
MAKLCISTSIPVKNYPNVISHLAIAGDCCAGYDEQFFRLTRLFAVLAPSPSRMGSWRYNLANV